MRRLAAVLLALAVATASVARADYRAGWDAFENGDYPAALRAWLPSAEVGDPQAQYALGIMLLYGRGMDADPPGAAAVLAPAAAAGLPEAAYALGTLYQDGEGVRRDFAEAARLYGVAALGGHTAAQNNLAIMLALGEGVVRNAGMAHTWFGLAAKGGDASAARNRDRVAAELTPTERAESDQRIQAFRTPRPVISSLPLNPAETYPGVVSVLKRVEVAVRLPEPPAMPVATEQMKPIEPETATIEVIPVEPPAPAPVPPVAVTTPAPAPTPARTAAPTPPRPTVATAAPLPLLPPRP